MNPKPNSKTIVCPICGRELPKEDRIIIRISYDVCKCMILHLKPEDKTESRDFTYKGDFPGWHTYCAWAGWDIDLTRPREE